MADLCLHFSTLLILMKITCKYKFKPQKQILHQSSYNNIIHIDILVHKDLQNV